MVFHIEKLDDSDGRDARRLTSSYTDQAEAEHIAGVLHDFLHGDGRRDVGYGVQVVNAKGHWVWRRTFADDYLGLDAERPG